MGRKQHHMHIWNPELKEDLLRLRDISASGNSLKRTCTKNTDVPEMEKETKHLYLGYYDYFLTRWKMELTGFECYD